MILKGCFYVRASVCRLCQSNIFGPRSGFGVDASHVAPQTVPALIPLVRSMSSVVLLGAYAGYGAVPPLCSWLAPCLGRACNTVWSRSPEDHIWADSTGLEWVPCPRLTPWFLKLTVSFLGVCRWCFFFFQFLKFYECKFVKTHGLIEFKDFCISHVVYYFESLNRFKTHLKTKPDLHLLWDFHILYVLRGNSEYENELLTLNGTNEYDVECKSQ